ncbi:hypothetical protein BDU57DRAFT_7115 [Ampelomyces quisqualis]|uniref:Zn(2)-C6 fungal-type domain-containing protein n=1 Tax=Ampelomyces quisqualis TaxID=50730 RepID=A0A6A5QXQ1_AMPQU|nr:hypothetical protein BDU57DRAFT_7115 [Ampelomyces quisqualis]
MDQPVQKRASKACDACKRRKVKCNGQDRCQQCAHLGLRCVYSASGKQRSQGKRGHIISEFRTQKANPKSSPPILPAIAAAQVTYQVPHDGAPQSVEASPVSPYPSQYSGAFFLSLIPDYMEGVYPVQPVIDEHELRHYINVMDTDQEVRSFIYAFGGATLNLTRYGDSRTEEVVQTIEHLMECSIESIVPPKRHCHSSVMRAMQSIFVHNCLMSLQASDAALYYMRDAISFIQMLRIDNAETAASLPAPERSRRQRMYWQAYIHERFIAILDYRHAILPPLYTLPEDDPTIPIQVHEGFNQIIKLFRLLDTEFLTSWLDTQASGTTGKVTSTWVEAKSRELEVDGASDARNLANLSMMQRADLTITREWLRTLVWRLAMGQTLLSSRSSKECLSLLFPVRLSQTLRAQVSRMSRQDIGVHGSSMTQKLFDITDTIADVLIHVPAATLDETALRIDDFLFILDFVLLFPQLDATRRGILLEKLQRLQTMFPEAVSSASNPNLPVESQSPRGNDPWWQVAQSKTAAGLEEIGEMQMMTGNRAGAGQIPRGEVRQGQVATWNDISKRLSNATFGTV